MRGYIIALLLICTWTFTGAQSAKEKGLGAITPELIRGQLEYLASDWMEGREIGTKGNFMAGDYIQSIFKMNGIQPSGDVEQFWPNRYQVLQGIPGNKYRTFFQNFEVIQVLPADRHSLSITLGSEEASKTYDYAYKTDFIADIADKSKKLHAPLVFIGYGFTDEALKYDDFKGIDVKGKIVLRIAGYPGKNDTNSLAYKKMGGKSQYEIDQLKNRLILKHGALAVIEYNPFQNETKEWVANTPFRHNQAMYEGDEQPQSIYDKHIVLPSKATEELSVITISERILTDILTANNISLEKFFQQTAQLQSYSGKLKKTKANIIIDSQTRLLKARNIIGKIEGERDDELIIVGAHYDHMGKYNGQVFNGADDNGSGTVAVMSIARACMAAGVKPKRTIIFACWDGEERSLAGSTYFVDNFKNIDKTMVYINFDMIGRDTNPKASRKDVLMFYTKAFPVLEKMNKNHVTQYNLNLETDYRRWENPVGGSDNSPFAREGIPIMWYHTNDHPDYHKASDHVELINWNKMLDIIKVSFLNIWELANREAPIVKEQTFD